MTTLIYIAAFLIGFVVAGGLSVALFILWLNSLKTDAGFGIVILILLGFVVSLGVGIAGGCVTVVVLGVRRGELLTALAIVFGILLLLGLAWLLRGVFAQWYTNTPAQRAEQEAARLRAIENQKREHFFQDYGTFLRAAGAGNIEAVTRFLNMGLPYVTVAPGRTPTHDREWAESVVESDFIQHGLAIFRLSGLEIAAWYGHTEVVALLLERQTGTPEQKLRLRQQALAYARKYDRTETVALLEATLAH